MEIILIFKNWGFKTVPPHCAVPEIIHAQSKEGRGLLKVQFFKGSFEAKFGISRWECVCVWGAKGVQSKKSFHGRGMDIFWNNTLSFLKLFHCLNYSHEYPFYDFTRMYNSDLKRTTFTGAQMIFKRAVRSVVS